MLDNAKALAKGTLEGDPRMKSIYTDVQTENMALQVELGLLTLPLYPDDWEKTDPIAQWQKQERKRNAKPTKPSNYDFMSRAAKPLGTAPGRGYNSSLQAVRWIVAKPPKLASCTGSASFKMREKQKRFQEECS